MIDQLQRLIAPLQRRVMLSIGRAVLNAVYDGNPSQLVQASMLSGETRDKMERLAEYGFTSVPHPGAQAVAVFVGGDRGHGIVVATGDSRYRLAAMEGGEVAIYDDQGQVVHLKRDGIHIETDDEKKVRVSGGNVEIHGAKSYSWDVNGFGERWTWLGGTEWEHKTWQEGATVTTVTGPINPPEGP